MEDESASTLSVLSSKGWELELELSANGELFGLCGAARLELREDEAHARAVTADDVVHAEVDVGVVTKVLIPDDGLYLADAGLLGKEVSSLGEPCRPVTR